MNKVWIVTYVNPNTGKDLDARTCVLHNRDCRYLCPKKNRPYTGMRHATYREQAIQNDCKVC